MRKKYDLRPFSEKLYESIYKHKIKIILLSFIFALCISFISLITSNGEGAIIIVFYPLALIGFILDPIIYEKVGIYGHRLFHFSIILMILSIIAFIAGFFID